MNKPKLNQHRLLFLMKVTLVHLLISSFSIAMAYAVEGFGQDILDRKVTLNADGAEFKNVLLLIGKQAKVKFAYSPELLEEGKKVSIHVQDAKLATVLSDLLSPSVSFKVIGKQIVLMPVHEDAAGEVTEELSRIDFTVTGRVTNATDGETVPGVNVMVKGTTIGATTDADGKYTVDVPNDDDAILVFSFIGYATQEVLINKRTTIDITLAEDIQTLGEIVVTALDIEREKKSLGFATQEVSGKALTEAAPQNLATGLYGKIAGLTVSQNTGGPMNGVKLQLRGIHSISGSNRPLIVVDGVPVYDNDTQVQFSYDAFSRYEKQGSGINDINPEDVESINILKGGNAAALYGSQAANGVIMITTKKGKKGNGLGIELTSNFSTESVSILPDFQNIYGQGSNPTFTQNADGDNILDQTSNSFGPKMDGTEVLWWDGNKYPYSPQPNNVKDFFKTGTLTNNTVAISNANEKSSYRFSYTNYDYKGILANMSQKKNVFAFNSNFKLADRVTVDLAVNYNNIVTTNRPFAFFSALVGGYVGSRSSRTDVIKNSYKTADGFLVTNDPDFSGENTNNPDNQAVINWWSIQEDSRMDTRDRFLGHTTLNLKILPWLSLRSKLGGDLINTNYENKLASTQKFTNADGSVYYSGTYYREEEARRVKYADIMLMANKELSSDFSMNFNAGFYIQEQTYNTITARTFGGFLNPNFYSLSNSKESIRGGPDDPNGLARSKSRLNAIFAFGQLSYRNYLFLDLTGRYEKNSTLSPDNNQYFYPSVSTSYVFSDAFELPTFVSFGKVRASYALVSKGPDPYRGIRDYSTGTFQGSPTSTFNNEVAISGKLLKPEDQHTIELGTEVKFLQNRLGIDFTFYKNININQIFGLPVAGSTGASSLAVNVGRVENNGIEFTAFGTPIKGSSFSWDVSLNISRNTSKLVKLVDGFNEYALSSSTADWYTAQVVGRPLGIIKAKSYKLDDQGRRIIKTNGLYEIDPIHKELGSVLPKAIGGLVNTLSYKRLIFTGLIDFRIGGLFLSDNIFYGRSTGKFSETLQGRDAEHGGVAYYTDANSDNIRLTEGQATPNGESIQYGMVLDGVKQDGTPNDVIINPRDYYNTVYQWGNGGIPENAAYENTYVKLRELSLAYMLPNRLVNKIGLKNLTVSLISRNLFYIYKNIPHIDPESYQSTGSYAASESGALPSTRSYGITLRTNF